MPAATAREAPKFLRRTSLGANEYHRNFRKIDCETISRLTSADAARVTTQMCKVYLSLQNAPAGFWEREGVLRFAGEERGGDWVTAWEQLVSLAGVASATARKALAWMHGQGIVGYFAGKNGVGIRVFMNRASSSIGVREGQGQKNLRLVPASTEAPRASACDTPFNDSYADLEVPETDINPRAPKSGAGAKQVGETATTAQPRTVVGVVPVEKIVERLKGELEPCVREAATRAAAQTTAREMERTREWFETKALPKAVRVAQRETYDLLRKQGGVGVRQKGLGAGAEVGRAAGGHAPPAARTLTPEEVCETAEVCVALLETQGKPIEATLSDLSSEGGGWLLPEDVPRVREAALRLAGAWGREGRASPTPTR